MMRRILSAFCLIALTAIPAIARADVRLPALFSDHMVLQQGQPVSVWGWADAGEAVTVSVAGQSVRATTGDDGKWRVALQPLEVAEGLELKVAGKNSLTVKDVLVGEVWLGSGQSNMAMTVSRCNSVAEEQQAARLPNLRMFTVTSGPATSPQDECKGQWVVCSPETVGNFSATAYFFGREIHRELQVPVGLINSSVGGTGIEAWTDLEVQQRDPELKPILGEWEDRIAAYNAGRARQQYERALAAWKTKAEAARAAGKLLPRRPQVPVEPRQDRNHPGNLFNGKIAPLIPYAVRGMVWYQGEHNTRPETATLYHRQLTLLITDWRIRWGQPELPFAWVQLPNFIAPETRDWPSVREGMLQTLEQPHTGMAIAIDVGDPKDIHPKNKQEIGRRLALWALHDVYGRDIPSSGPIPTETTLEGRSLEVRFKHADGGLELRGEHAGFEVAGTDGVWKTAEARVESDTLTLSSLDVPQPHAARYAWSNNPTAVLFNKAGLPATPFRTALPKP
ncbi:sialate O-acetylesterase [Planctellipticum variicoloris]|uniref:sialate O-acetylesterase n=1 Tax=Planctellipticum variicoloris TaxID=3064265 RepID=UPI003013883B|nr:sialate O-acetylesterase [Planctomycetaceae bacterium SH412]